MPSQQLTISHQQPLEVSFSIPSQYAPYVTASIRSVSVDSAGANASEQLDGIHPVRHCFNSAYNLLIYDTASKVMIAMSITQLPFFRYP
jgi:hypothetical protein